MVTKRISPEVLLSSLSSTAVFVSSADTPTLLFVSLVVVVAVAVASFFASFSSKLTPESPLLNKYSSAELRVYLSFKARSERCCVNPMSINCCTLALTGLSELSIATVAAVAVAVAVAAVAAATAATAATGSSGG